MRRDRLSLYIVGSLFVGGFLYGIIALLILRYETGDVYPPYSSLRTDPLGTKAFYEGIDELRGLSSARNYKSLARLKEIQDTTLLYIGMQPAALLWVDQETKKTFEEIVWHGNRLIIAFFPVSEQPVLREIAVEEENSTEEDSRQEDNEQAEEEQENKELEDVRISFVDWWGVDFGYTDKAFEPISAKNQSDSMLPETVSWHTALYFDLADSSDWRVIYAVKGRPVLIEKKFGKGSVIFSADSYFFSNEAMRNERHASLLTWLLGSSNTILFDETHLGVAESPGIASLIRKYRLGWFVAGLVGLVLLFVWKNMASFVPPHKTTLTTGERSDRDVMAGLVNLLRQNISPQDLLRVCFDEWQKSFSHRRKELGTTFNEMQHVVQEEQSLKSRKRDPVRYYQRLSRILKRAE